MSHYSGYRTIQCLIKQFMLCIILMTAMISNSCINDEEQEYTHENTSIVKVGDKAPDFSVQLLNGERLTLSSLQGQVTMLIFFSTGCPDCQAQFAEMQKQIAVKEPNFRIVAISREESAETTATFIQQYGLKFDVGIDPNRSIYNQYASRFVPRNYLIGSDGYVKALTVEYILDEFHNIWQQAERLSK